MEQESSGVGGEMSDDKARKTSHLRISDVFGDGVWLPYPPSGNRYWRHVGTRVVLSREARVYRAQVARLLVGCVPLEGDVGVEVLIYRPSRRGDLDNTLKVLLDAVQGFAYRNDSQVTCLRAQRFDGTDEPGVRLKVKPAVGFGP